MQDDAATEKRGTDEANVTKIDHEFGRGQGIHECQSQAGIIQQVFEQTGEFFADLQDGDIRVWLLSCAGRNGHDRAFGIGYFADLSVADRAVSMRAVVEWVDDTGSDRRYRRVAASVNGTGRHSVAKT